MCQPLGTPAAKPSGEDMISVCSDDIMHELASELPEEEEPPIGPNGKAPSNSIRKAPPSAQLSGDVAPPAQPAGETADPFIP
eukprot:9185179-Pyramimonas_sp.AAC.1